MNQLAHLLPYLHSIVHWRTSDGVLLHVLIGEDQQWTRSYVSAPGADPAEEAARVCHLVSGEYPPQGPRSWQTAAEQTIHRELILTPDCLPYAWSLERCCSKTGGRVDGQTVRAHFSIDNKRVTRTYAHTSMAEIRRDVYERLYVTVLGTIPEEPPLLVQ